MLAGYSSLAAIHRGRAHILSRRDGVDAVDVRCAALFTTMYIAKNIVLQEPFGFSPLPR
jgi:hypothetical protein